MKRAKRRNPATPRGTPSGRRQPPTALRPWLLAAALVLLVALVYWPTLDNGFTWDDDDYVVNNRTLTSLGGLRDIWFKLGAIPQYYPLVHSTFWIEHHLWGLDPRGYHVVNLLLHATAAVLVWRLLLRLAVPGAWLAAALFAVHPASVESVAWVTERKNVLSCGLALASLLAYLRFSPADEPPDTPAPVSPAGWRFYALSLLLFVAALLSKTVTAAVPAVLLVVLWWKRGRLTRRDLTLTAPFFAIGLALAAVTVFVEKSYVGASGDEWDLSAVDRVLIAGRALWFYTGKLAWPHPLIFFYPRWTVDASQGWQYVFPAAALAVVVALWLARNRLGRGPLAAVLIFAGVLVPALGFFNVYPFRYSFVADHFQYHASIALFALAAAGAAILGRSILQSAPWAVGIAVISVLLPLSLIAHERTTVYKSLVTLHENTLALNPTAWVAPQGLGKSFSEQGKHQEAISQFRRAIAIREQLVHDFPEANYHREGLTWCYVALGKSLQATGQFAEAEALHRRALEIRQRQAQDHPAQAAKYQSQVAAGFVDIGLIQRELGRLSDAEESLHQALAIREKLVQDDPSRADYQAGLAWCHFDLALVERETARPSEAAASLRKAIEIREELARAHPDVPGYQNSAAANYVDLGILQGQLEHWDAAEESFGKAVALREALVRDHPVASEYQADLGWSYARLSGVQALNHEASEAESSCRKAIEVRQRLVGEHPQMIVYQRELATSDRDLANLQLAASGYADAAATLRRAIELREEIAHSAQAVPSDRASLIADLTTGGDALAWSGKWSESAKMFSRAADWGDSSRLLLERMALARLAAGDEQGYRATCAELAKISAQSISPAAARSLATIFVLHNASLRDMSQVVTLARRAAEKGPPGHSAAILVAAAEFRVGNRDQPVAAMQAALAALDSTSTGANSEPDLINRLLAEMILVEAEFPRGQTAASTDRAAILRNLINKADTAPPVSIDSLPPWTARAIAQMARQRLSRPQSEPPEQL